jgi:uncharacterized membrane protein
MIFISFIYILYVTYNNLLYDPKAVEFLGHKINLNHPINIPVWLNVMHIHVVCACLALITGAINFSNGILRKHRKFHRVNGYLYVIFIFAVCGTSGYMAPYSTGGRINSIAFNLINIIWFAMTITALVQIKQNQLNSHRKWMVRSYAFCFTNMFINLVTFVLSNGLNLAYELSYTIGVYGSIILIFALAEFVIRTVYKMPTQLQRVQGKYK